MSNYIKKGYYSEEDYAKKSMVLGICSVVLNLCYWMGVGFWALIADASFARAYGMSDITSIIILFFIMWIVCIAIYVCGIKSILFYNKWVKEGDDKRGYAIAGMVCGIIGMAVGIFQIIVTVGYTVFASFLIMNPGPWLPS
ncbi:MAG: hypothetical protein J1E62_05545 [Lachnospiraceae bacterium]|nr:hypothetical protein [Lachnospiraceae bacterium]